MLKNKSYFKRSMGDEAGCAPKKGVITSKNMGKVYFTMWSMDVKIEGENVVRHLDLTTHNHGSTGNTPPWPHTDKMVAAFNAGGKCAGMEHLRLRPYSSACPNTAGGKKQTGHHLIPGRCLRDTDNYSHGLAPVICVSRGNQHQGSHKRCHAKFDPVEFKYAKKKTIPYSTARTAAASSAGGAMNPPRELTKKEKDCVAFQLDQYYKAKPPSGPGVSHNSPLRASGAPGKVLPKSKTKAGVI